MSNSQLHASLPLIVYLYTFISFLTDIPKNDISLASPLPMQKHRRKRTKVEIESLRKRTNFNLLKAPISLDALFHC